MPAQDEPAAPNPLAIINGRVIGPGARAIAGRRIFASGGKRPGGTIERDGSFEIRSPQRICDRRLFVRLGGAKMMLNATASADLGETTEVLVEVELGHEVGFRVVSKSTRSPIRDVEVTLRQAGRRSDARTLQARALFGSTDLDGRFRTALVPEGAYRLEIDAPGFRRREVSLSVPLASETIFELEDAAPIHVLVNGMDSYPDHSRVSLGFEPEDVKGEGGFAFIQEGEPGARGRFAVDAPAPGQWNVRLSSWDPFPDLGQPLFVPENATELELVFDVPVPAALHGRLLDDRGRPIEGVRLGIYDERCNVTGDGTFDFPRLQPGRAGITLWIREDEQTLYSDLGLVELIGDSTCDLVIGGRSTLIVRLDGLPPGRESPRLDIRLESLQNPRATWFFADNDRVEPEVPLSTGGVIRFPRSPVTGTTDAETLRFPFLQPERYRMNVLVNGEFYTREILEVGEGTQWREFAYREPAIWEFRVAVPGSGPLPERIEIRAPAPPDPAEYSTVREYWRAQQEWGEEYDSTLWVSERVDYDGGPIRVASRLAGVHDVEIRARGFARFVTEIHSELGEMTIVRAVLEPKEE